MSVVSADRPMELTLQVGQTALPHLREMARQQLLGDRELLSDVLSGREDPELRLLVADRLRYVEHLAGELGVVEGPIPSSKSHPLLTLLTLSLALLVTSTMGVGWALLFGATGLGAIYAPVVAWAAVHYGVMTGLGAALASVVLWESVVVPMDGTFQALHAGLIFVCAMVSLVILVYRGKFSGRPS